MATFQGVPIYAMCRIMSATRAAGGTMDYLIHADFSRLILIVTPDATSETYSDDVIVNTNIETTDSEISAALRSGAAQQLNIRTPYDWTEADIRGLSL